MAEKLRRIKKEQPFLEKKWRYFFLVCAVSMIAFAVAVGGWSIVVNWRKGHRPVVSVDNQKDLTAVICRGQECFWLNGSGLASYSGIGLSGSLVLNLAD